MVAINTVVVIFVSTRTPSGEREYAEAAQKMEQLASQQEGFISVQSVRDSGSGQGITISYWRDDQAASSWKLVAEHQSVQEFGRTHWYADYSVVVAEVTRAYEVQGA